MLKNAETIFEPKKVHCSMDWLKTQNESGQDLGRYSNGGPGISWLNPKLQNTIYLFVIDDSITDAQSEQFLLYCKAFYTGIRVELLKAGAKLYEESRGKKVLKKTVPDNFVQAHNITGR